MSQLNGVKGRHREFLDRGRDFSLLGRVNFRGSVMFHADLSQLFPWMLAIFTVLGLIACCAWFYKCLKKCNDRCSLLRSEHNMSHSTQSSRPDPHDFYQIGAYRTSRPSASVHVASTSLSTSLSTPLVNTMRESYAYRGPFALKTHFVPPYAHLAPPPSYDEAMSSQGGASPAGFVVNVGQSSTQQEMSDMGLQEEVHDDGDQIVEEEDEIDDGRQDDLAQLTETSSGHSDHRNRENNL
ncbi:uncharacterized protein LOC100888726 [Strongylocentrotus purpuratus]|uniref:Uncharacterized protein n=1 Tax=Strongylocentrotus purpuratus TaxID=7668 RepID=A0A7M7GIW7_STRPU|nr:uncharacterized protein LOC100888726 [Strongylocentrotus purpuratus]